MDHRNFFYTQDSISNYFGRSTRHRDMCIGDTLDELINGLATVASIPIIGVCWWKGKWFTHDNRRLWVYRKEGELGIINLIPVYEPFAVNPMKFTT